MDKQTIIRLIIAISFIYCLMYGGVWFLVGMVVGMAPILTIMATKSTLMMWVLKVMDSEIYAGEILGWQKKPKNKRNEYIGIKK